MGAWSWLFLLSIAAGCLLLFLITVAIKGDSIRNSIGLFVIVVAAALGVAFTPVVVWVPLATAYYSSGQGPLMLIVLAPAVASIAACVGSISWATIYLLRLRLRRLA